MWTRSASMLTTTTRYPTRCGSYSSRRPGRPARSCWAPGSPRCRRDHRRASRWSSPTPRPPGSSCSRAACKPATSTFSRGARSSSSATRTAIPGHCSNRRHGRSVPVNKAHLEFCSSPEWARLVEDELLPWVLDGCELGDDLLEVGPGPGLTTDVLRALAARVTAVELDLDLAGELARPRAGGDAGGGAGGQQRPGDRGGRDPAAVPGRPVLRRGLPDDAAPHSVPRAPGRRAGRHRPAAPARRGAGAVGRA